LLDPREEYAKRLEIRIKAVARKESQHIRLGNAKLVVVAAAIVLLWLIFANHVSAYWLALPAGTYATLAILHEQTIRARDHAKTAAAFYRAGFARMDDRWSGTGATGDRFRDPKHVYADDLDLFGRGCLFELLSTSRLPMGENRLAEWLLSPSPVREIIDRQRLVTELNPKLDLREDLAVTVEDLRARLNPESLTKWCDGESPVDGGIGLRIIAAALAVAAVATLLFYFATANYWPILGVLFVELLAYSGLHKRAAAVISEMNCNAEGLDLFSKILQRVERESFVSPRLQQHVAELKRGPEPASRSIDRFARIVYWIDGHDSLMGRILDVPVLYTIQTALAAEAWRTRHGHRMSIWIDVVAEIEALLSLATYSFEHPADPFPEFTAIDSAPLFAGDDLGHPLIPSGQCVPNSIRLDEGTRVLLVSGSNMSGKSTLLRTVGINTVLAMAGAPIRGKSLRLAALSLGTRLRSADSLQEGRSTFYTEVLRIRQVLDLARGHRHILFLFDELLDGTNSHDRRIGAESLLRAFLQCGSIGMVTTHDLALTEMAESLGAIVHNVHFQDFVENGLMRFDYKLRDGVVARSNALELMRLAGLDV
jgi:MutS domain V